MSRTRCSRSARKREPPVVEQLSAADEGRAMIEVIFLGVLMLIPVIYVLIAILRIQAATTAVNQAARDAGRAMDAAPSVAVGADRARQIAEIALADQHVPAQGLALRFVAAGAGCESAQIVPSTAAGDSYDVCVSVILTIPGVPTVLSGSRNTTTGVYTVHVGELREGG